MTTAADNTGVKLAKDMSQCNVSMHCSMCMHHGCDALECDAALFGDLRRNCVTEANANMHMSMQYLIVKQINVFVNALINSNNELINATTHWSMHISIQHELVNALINSTINDQ